MPAVVRGGDELSTGHGCVLVQPLTAGISLADVYANGYFN